MIGQETRRRGHVLPLLEKSWLLWPALAIWAAMLAATLVSALPLLGIGPADLWPLLALALVLAGFGLGQGSFLITELSYRLPLIGKLARYSRDFSEASPGGWLNVEIALCRDYAKHLSALSEADFNNYSIYLRKAFDLGRKPLPGWVVLLVFLMVMLETLGISYLLGGAIEVEALRLWLLVGIVAALAAILGWVMHAAGRQLHRTRLLRIAWRIFDPDPDSPFVPHFVALSEDQSSDDDKSPAAQFLSRVIARPDDRGSYAWIWLASLLMGAAAIALVVLRMEAVSGGVADTSRMSSAGAAIGALAERTGVASFAILAAVFVVTQFVALGLGYWYGFAGRESAEAYAATRGAADYHAYFRPILRRMAIADVRLTMLHRMLERYSPLPTDWRRDFLDFIREERARGATNLQWPPSPPETS